jgi:hypothetical protein
LNYGGQPLLSRQTVSLGRSVMVLSLAVILIAKYEINTENLELFGVVLGDKDLSGPIMWTLGTLVASFVVNWIGDVISLNFFSFSVRKKTKGRLFDDGSDEMSHLDSILAKLDSFVNQAEGNGLKPASFGNPEAKDLSAIRNEISALRKSATWFNGFKLVYVVLWNFLMPVGLAAFAVYLILNA